MDLGANDGKSMNLFLTESKKLTAPLSDDWEVYLFEVNSKFENLLKRACKQWGLKFTCQVAHIMSRRIIRYNLARGIDLRILA